MFAVPLMQVRTRSLVIYPEVTRRYKPRHGFDPFRSRFDQNGQPAAEKRKAYSGTVTEGARKRITKAVTLLIQSTPERMVHNPVSGRTHPFKLSFITLTVSSTTRMLTAREAHRTLLEPFLRYLRVNHQMKSYIWKAELQKRGQIHYHLTSDVFINHTTLREKWNEYQIKNGLLDDYYHDQGHYNANSTDVHSVYKIKNIEAYLIKYLAKPGSVDDQTDGKIWDCSQNLKKCPYYTTIVDNPYKTAIVKLIEAKRVTVYYGDRFTIIKTINETADQILSQKDQQEFRTHCFNIRNYIPPARKRTETPPPIERTVFNPQFQVQREYTVPTLFTKKVYMK